MGIKPIALFIALLVLPLQPLASPQSSPAPKDRYLCVEAKAPQLRSLGLSVDEVYPSFVTLRASAEDERLLREMDINFFELPRDDEVTVPSGTFTIPPESLQSKGLDGLSLPGDGPSYFIVKLKGPEKGQWFDEVRATGATTAGGPLSHYNFIVCADGQQINAIARMPFVRWVGELKPEYKVPYALPAGEFQFDMVFFKEAPGDFATALDIVLASGGTIVELDNSTDWWNSAVVSARTEAARLILGAPGLWDLETVGTVEPRNDVARWVVQSFDPTTEATPYWDAGLIGVGEVVGLADSGIDYDHIAFRNKMDDAGVPGPDDRKIVEYNTSIDPDALDQIGHGTHVAGSLAGDSLVTPLGYDTYDGLAYGSKIAFFDIVDPNGSWDPPLIRSIFADAYQYGVRTHSDSWGDNRPEYTLRSQRVDQFQWDNPDFLSCWAAGNTGPANKTVLEPATAKNAVAVGAAVNGNSTDLASFSSHGPTQEGLYAPTVVAPGVSIISAASDGQKNTLNDGYKSMSGTSMSTPFVSAASVIIDQYFRDGFYPNGSFHSGDGFQASGPLRKAILVASGLDMNGGKYVGGPIPDYGQGWGKVVLANALYLSSYEKSDRLWVADYYNDSHINDGLATGETRTDMVTVNSSKPLKVVLTWNDWPGAGLVNDLNLEVTCPNGTLYRGNQFVNGSSVVSTQADSVNTVEAVIIPRPALGLYIINVTALTVGNGSRQRYSLVATGDLFDSSVGLLRLDRERTGLNSVVGVSLMDRDLRGIGTVTVNATSTTEANPVSLVLRETGNTGSFEGSLTLMPGTPVRDGMLQVSDGDTVRVYYNDANPPGVSWDSCVVDGTPPAVSDVVVDNITNSTAFLSFDTDELSTANISYNDGVSGWQLTDATATFHHALELRDLTPRTDYSAGIEVSDLFGNLRSFEPNGSVLDFRTHDLTYRPGAGDAGWAGYGEEGNHFAEEGFSVGMVDGYPRLGGILFDTSGFPPDSMVTGAQLRLMVRNADGAAAESLWSVELLESGSAGLFDARGGRPNYTELKDAAYLDTLGDQFGPAAAVPGHWQVFVLTAAQCRVLGRSLLDGHTVFRIKGPLSGPDSVLEWYSGQSGELAFWKPQLVLDLDYPPSVYPWAATKLVMNESTVDSTSVTCSRIFHDEEPLTYDTPTNFEGSGSNITVTIAPDGRVTFRPRQYWNGEEPIELRATDTYGLSAVQVITVTVLPVNDPPHIVEVNGTAAREGMTFYVRQDETFKTTVDVEDPDLQFGGERLWYVTNDTLVRFESPSSPVISFKPQNDDVGTRLVRITVRDPDYEDSLNLTFIIENVNDPPSAFIELPVAGAAYNNETPIHFSAHGSMDPDLEWGDELNFTWESNNSGPIGFGEELNATLPPGKHVVTLIVRDLVGAFDMATVEIKVQAVEHPPPPPPPPPATNPSGDTRGLLLRIGGVVLLVLALTIALLLLMPRLRRPAPNVPSRKGKATGRPRTTKKAAPSRRQKSGGGGAAGDFDEEELGGEGRPIEVKELGND